jgi:hypothetical protein
LLLTATVQYLPSVLSSLSQMWHAEALFVR